MLLTLAAGLGTRVQSGDYTPKALIQISNRPLLFWSIDSFHALRAKGMLREENIFVAARQSELDEFDFESHLKDHCGRLSKIVPIDFQTRGPAETAFLALGNLLKQSLVSKDDILILNDCDHHYDGSKLMDGLSRIESSSDNSVLLCTTTKDPKDLSWSFVLEKNEVVTGLVEKPVSQEIEGINYSEGIIGTYIFGSIEMYLDLYNSLSEKEPSTEIFISSVIDLGLNTRRINRLEKVQVERFTSLGTRNLVDKARSEKLLGGSFKEPGSIILDVDGTILIHDDGGGVGKFDYQKTGILVESGIPDWIRQLKKSGFTIVLMSARNEESRGNLEKQLEYFGILYDLLIMGISGGPRFLLNDTKDSLPIFPTAYSFNFPRNKLPLMSIDNQLRKVSNLKIRDEYFGESGERTFIVSNGSNMFVRKSSQDTESSRALIHYQVKWMELVREVLPECVPRIYASEISPNASIHYFDCEFIPNAMPFGMKLQKQSSELQRLNLQGIVRSLSTIYSKFNLSCDDNLSYLQRVFKDKALPGLSLGFERLELDLDSYIAASVNGNPIGKVYQKVCKVFFDYEQKITGLLNHEKDIKTLIHGDPTLSNIVVNDQNKAYLLDPIGTRVLPGYSYEKHGLGRTNPIFDLSRIQLSLKYEYERWRNDIHIEEAGGQSNYSLEIDSQFTLLYDYLRDIWPEDFKCKNQFIDDLLFLTTLCRIFPYKAKDKKKEAMYLLGLISQLSESLNERLF